MAELEGVGITEEDVAYFLGWMMNTGRRNYDILLAILATHSPEKAKELYEIHERGEFLFPPPWAQDGE
jgi:hypothetical protein